MTTRTDLAFLRRRGGPPPGEAPPAPDGASSGDVKAAIADFVAGRSRRPGREQPAGSASPGRTSAGDLDVGPTAAGAQPPFSAFLRSRSRRPARSAEEAPEQTPSSGAPLDLDGPTAPPADAASSSLDLDEPTAPAPSSSLDLGEPAPAASPALDADAANPLDLGTSEADTAERRRSAPTSGDPLSLDAPAGAPAPAATSRSGRHHRLVTHDLALPTIDAGERRRMDEEDAVVHLTRAQSAFGSLDILPAVPAGADLRLGVAYECQGVEGVVQPAVAPMGPDPRSPIFRVSEGGIVINLRRVTAIDRFLIYAVLGGQDKKMPGGTVVVGTYGGSRLELPLGTQPTYGAQALLTGYVIEGRIVLRAEHDPFSGTLHQVCDAYGFSELTWRDPFTPLI